VIGDIDKRRESIVSSNVKVYRILTITISIETKQRMNDGYYRRQDQ